MTEMTTEIPSGYEGNLPDIDKQFAVVAVEAAETYWKLLECVPANRMKLTKHDDEIYSTFKEEFPDFFENIDRLRIVDEGAMKSNEGKTKWRKWLKRWEKDLSALPPCFLRETLMLKGFVEDYNFGTILRTNCRDEFTESNAMFCLRAQAYAIEIARLRHGLNDWVYEAAQKKKAEEAAAAAPPADSEAASEPAS